ncbi:hypothetical protein EBZ38_07460 [bacterium]|nr:hypothetical protein [bacterium]
MEKLFIWVIALLVSWIAVIFVTFSVIWSINMLFSLDIAYNVGTAAAAIVLIVFLFVFTRKY